jgi:arylsulfatase A-like enzyme
LVISLICLAHCANGESISQASVTHKPNILFIAMDDLNDWTGCLGGHPQAFTPNIDRLARSGVLFSNAHCAAPSCNPSRTAVFTGIAPNKSGVYDNRQDMRTLLPDAVLMPDYFRQHGYRAMGSGKMLHYFIDARSWDDYYPDKNLENPFPRHMDWGERPKSLPFGGKWQYKETDWFGFDVSDEEYGGDYHVAEWVSGELGRHHENPFFLACGFYRPHEPWFVPKKYFDLFPLEKIQMPSGYNAHDLEDLPEAGKRLGPNRYLDHIQKHDQWKQAIQGYLASIAFSDAMLGKVLSALENGPNKNSTIIVLWSDHGWHLGEKNHWQKFTCWRVCTRVPLIITVPPGISKIMDGTRAGVLCDRPVNLLSLFPTLTDLAGLPTEPWCDGPSLLPLLKNVNEEWSHPSITYLQQPGGYSISERCWRYIHYPNGEEELYDISNDPHEWQNLAGQSDRLDVLESMRAKAPSTFAPKVNTH